MNTIIIDYWAQIAIILAALGYLIRILLDHGFKRREIGYSIYARERLSSITNFISKYEKAQMEMRAISFIIKANVINNKKPFHIGENLLQLLNQLRDEMRHSRLFISSSEFNLFHELTACLDSKHSDLVLMEVGSSSQEFLIAEKFQIWYDEFEATMNQNEALLEEFIDKQRLRYMRFA